MYETYILTLAGIVLVLLMLVGLIFKFFSYIKRQDERNKQTYMFVETMLKMQNDLLAKLVDSKLKIDNLEVAKVVEETTETSYGDKDVTIDDVKDMFVNKNIQTPVDSNQQLKAINNLSDTTCVVFDDNSTESLLSYYSFNTSVSSSYDHNQISAWEEFLIKYPKFNKNDIFFSVELLSALGKSLKLTSETVCLKTKRLLLNGKQITYLTVNYIKVLEDYQPNTPVTTPPTLIETTEPTQPLSVEISNSVTTTPISLEKGIISNLNNRRKSRSI